MGIQHAALLVQVWVMLAGQNQAPPQHWYPLRMSGLRSPAYGLGVLLLQLPKPCQGPTTLYLSGGP